MINYGQVVSQPHPSHFSLFSFITQGVFMSDRRITHINYRPFCH